MSILVTRYQRNQKLGDAGSPLLYYLKRTPGNQRVYNEEDVAQEIEVTGAMSAEDVTHTFKAFKRVLRRILGQGDKVKINGLGTFYTTFSCTGSEEEKDCTVRNIQRVHVRFAVDNSLRLVNESNATTRGGDNNVEFSLSPALSKGEGEGPSGGNKPGGNENPGGGDEFIDPSA
ncbi:HU family DNA-binding protein [Bacteroides sp. 224]|uniref:HU family DNA-binding protein n=1 Tax=Bacteroides sp. 224 TaxID=2302936 RepID=UPI0019403213|nr:HU family DNA-binding protein [Bacteroides sp. 224]